MQFYSYYRQKNPDVIKSFIKSQPYGMLTTQGEDRPHVGLFNHVYDGEYLYLHLNKKDQQVADLRANNRALMVFHDFLGTIPSHWVDETYAGAATSYYLYAECDCLAEVIEDSQALTLAFNDLMTRFQPEGKFMPFDPESPVYKSSYAMLVIVKLKITSMEGKWKLGQNRPDPVRLGVAEKFRRRGLPNDARCADLIEADIKSKS